MKPSTAILCLLFAVLTGCETATPPAGELILSREDLRLKRTPYQPYPCHCEEPIKVDCSK